MRHAAQPYASLYDTFYGPIRFPEKYEAYMEAMGTYDPLPRKACNKDEVALVMGMTKRMVSDLIRSKRLFAIHVTHAFIVVPVESIARFIDKHYVPAEK